MFELSVRWFIVGLDASLKAALLALLAAAAIRLLRIRDSNVRHRVWAGVLGGMLLLPLLTSVVPALGLPIALNPDWLVALLPTAASESPNPNEVPDAQSGSPATREAEQVSDTGDRPDSRIATVRSEPSFEDGWEIARRGRQGTGSMFISQSASVDDSAASVDAPPAGAPSGPLAAEQSGVQELPGVPAPPRRIALLAHLPAILCGIWLAGALWMTLRLMAGLWTASQLCRESAAIDPVHLTEIVRPSTHGERDPRTEGGAPHPALLSGGEGARAARRAVPVFECPAITVPVSVGLVRPRILLPPDWIDWPAEKLEAILAHERTHVERADCACTLLAEINRCLYWFHPLAWWLGQHLSALAEAACDDAAIDSTGDRARYARHLLEVATSVTWHNGRVLPMAVSMARRSSVELRINSILDFTRPLSKRLTWASTIILIGIIAPIIGIAAALRPAPEKLNTEKLNTEKLETEKLGAAPAANVAASDESPTREQASDEASPLRDHAPEIALTNAPHEGETSSSDKDRDATFVYEGTIVDETGKLIAGAEITLDGWRKIGLRPGEPVAATTDERGRFRFTRRKSDFVEAGMAGSWAYARLIARKDGFGFATGPAAHFESTGALDARLDDEQRRIMEIDSGKKTNVLKLVADVPIRGRILDIEGQPVAGAKIEVINVWRGNDGSLDQWQAAMKERGADGQSAHRRLRMLIGGNFLIGGPRFTAVAPVQTGDDGWFTLSGLGRERIADAFVSAPAIETQFVHIRSQPGETINLPHDIGATRPSEDVFYPAEFTHVAGPSTPISGRVTDSKLGQPLAGVLLNATSLAGSKRSGGLVADYIRTTTDADGHYHLEGLPPGQNTLLFLPPPGMRNMAGEISVTVTASAATPLIYDVALSPAALVRGRAIDKQSGKPLAGHVQYFAHPSNPQLAGAGPFRRAHLTFSYWVQDGQFEIPVLPGKGILALAASSHEQYPRGVGGDTIDFPKRGDTFITEPWCIPNNFHLLTPLDIEADQREVKLELELVAGASFTGRVLTSDGRALSDYFVNGELAQGGWDRNERELFTVKGYYPQDGRRLFFYHPAEDLAGFRELTGEPPQKLEVVLAPAATISGRIVDEEGRPVNNAILDNASRVTGDPADKAPPAGQVRGEFLDSLDGKKIVTDADGRFILKGIVPGLSYSARASLIAEPGKRISAGYPALLFGNVVCERAEAKQLGNLRLKKPEDDAAKGNVGATSPAASGAAADRDKDNAATTEKGKKDHDLRFTGRVLDPLGNPASGATVRIDALRRRRFAGSGEPFQSAPVATLTTDASGRFERTVKESSLPEALLPVPGRVPQAARSFPVRNDRCERAIPYPGGSRSGSALLPGRADGRGVTRRPRRVGNQGAHRRSRS